MTAIDTAPVGWSPPSDSTAVTALLMDDLRRFIDAGDFVATLRASAELARSSRCSPDPSATLEGLRALATHGPVAHLAVIESLASMPNPAADELLCAALGGSDELVRRHATWRLTGRTPRSGAVTGLLEQLLAGGIDTMHAHRTLRRWATTESTMIRAPAEGALSIVSHGPERARIIDLLMTLDSRREPIDRDASVPERTGGLRLAQITLASSLDGELSRGGRGDTGGVASLLVSLGEQLVGRADVDHVVTIGRRSDADALRVPVESCDNRLSYASISVGDEVRPAESAPDAWEHLPTIERDIRRALRAARPLDMVHLRMADVGTLAAVEVAQQLGLPVCFSLAPDPHHVIATMQAREGLDQQTFVQLDAEANVWFRARLVERLAATSDRIALFPGSRSARLIDERPQRRPGQRRAVVAEGVDVTLARQAATEVARGDVGPAIDVLDELAGRIPPSRRGLPIVLSVGRLHPVKGMERVIEAWADDELIQATSNLVIVGGELDDPSRTEQQVLDSIERALPRNDPRRSGLVLLGGRPRRDIAYLMAATAAGRADGWAPGGLYVDGAQKEEFGLAVLEALAAGLVVIAPSTGGPSSYVDHGEAGILVDPGDDLALAIRSAFALNERSGRSERSRAMVESTYAVATMAADLVALYS